MNLPYHESTGSINFDRYFSYIESIRGKLPSHVFAFASQAKYYDLESPTSLHDAWLA